MQGAIEPRQHVTLADVVNKSTENEPSRKLAHKIFDAEGVASVDILAKACSNRAMRDALTKAVETVEATATLKAFWPTHLEEMLKIAKEELERSLTPFNPERDKKRAVKHVYAQKSVTAEIKNAGHEVKPTGPAANGCLAVGTEDRS